MPFEFLTAMKTGTQIPKSILTVLNQLYAIEQNLAKHGDVGGIGRNIEKMKDSLAEDGLLVPDAEGGQMRIGLVYEDPMGQPCKDTRTDLAANIAGTGTENLVVVDVIKPIIRAALLDHERGPSWVVQKGIVTVESRKEPQNSEPND